MLALKQGSVPDVIANKLDHLLILTSGTEQYLITCTNKKYKFLLTTTLTISAINTVQAVLRKLLKYQLVEVADIVYSGTVLSRSYRPTITSEEFAVHEVTSDYLAFEKTLSKPLLVSALLDTEEDPVKARETIDELQKMLDEYKKTLEEQEP